jgi:transposase
MCQNEVVEDLKQGRPSVTKIIRIGVDTSKSVFVLHGVDAAEQPVLRKKLRRRQVLEFFAKLEPTKIGLEACGGTHYWARELRALGHEAVLLPPQYVKPYLKRNKNDAADAEAICEAMSRPTMRFVSVKTAEQQAALMLAGLREQLVNRRTQLSNAIRGYAGEFGLTAARGLDKVEPLLARIAADATLPELARELFAAYDRQYAEVQKQVREIEAKMMAWHKSHELSGRLAEVPSIGPVGASLMTMKVINPRAFRSGRDFAAWIGLTPKDHSTAGRQRLGVITHAGDETLRRTLIVGATAVIKQVRCGRGHPSPWLLALLKRKPPKLAAVALANRTARIAWKLMVSGERYNPHLQPNCPIPSSPPGDQDSAARTPSRPLRAAFGGGRRPALTALSRGSFLGRHRSTEQNGRSPKDPPS